MRRCLSPQCREAHHRWVPKGRRQVPRLAQLRASPHAYPDQGLTPTSGQGHCVCEVGGRAQDRSQPCVGTCAVFPCGPQGVARRSWLPELPAAVFDNPAIVSLSGGGPDKAPASYRRPFCAWFHAHPLPVSHPPARTLTPQGQAASKVPVSPRPRSEP